MLIFNTCNTCRCGGIGRRTGLKIQRETMWVRVPPSVPQISIAFAMLKNLLKGGARKGAYRSFVTVKAVENEA